MNRLKIDISGQLQVDVFLDGAGPWTVGSSLDCHIPIRGRGISRKHVELQRIEGKMRFKDLGSTNGTFRAEEKVEEGVLREGDVLRVGSALLRLADTATERVFMKPLPDNLRLVSLTSLNLLRALDAEGDPRREFTMEDVAHLVGTFLAEGKAGLEWAMLCGFLQESLRCKGVVCYERLGDNFVLKASDGSFPTDMIHPGLAQQVAALPSMGAFRLEGPSETMHLISIPITYDQRKVSFLGVSSEEANPLLRHQEILPVVFVLCRLVLRWAEELRQRDDTVGDLKARIRQVESGLSASAESLEPIIGKSLALTREIETASQAAPTDLSVLLSGPKGSGKELFAHRIHRLSKHAAGPFVPLSCASVPETQMESELFGVEGDNNGGGNNSREGFFEKAGGGTLFIEEIADLPVMLQPKILRVLQEKHAVPLGGTRARPVNVRIVAATDQNPLELMAAGKLREDLYYRLAEVVIHVPPLRERGEDILLLANYFIQVGNREFGKRVRGFEEGAVQALRRYTWPGNVRQLQALVKHLVLMSQERSLSEAAVEAVLERAHPGGGRASGAQWDLPWEEAYAAFEEEYFRRRLASHRGSVTRLAKDVGITRPNLYIKMKKWGLRPGSD